MSDEKEKKQSTASKVVGWIIIIVIVTAVWQCATGGGSSASSSASSNSSSVAAEALENLRHSPAARVSDRSQALSFVLGLRSKGIDQRGVDSTVDLLRAAGLNKPADLIDQANREIGD